MFGKKIGLPEAITNALLDKFCTTHDQTDKLIENSFLSDELKKQYRMMYKSRVNSSFIIKAPGCGSKKRTTLKR
jgi:serine/threonine-protein kinase HipA